MAILLRERTAAAGAYSEAVGRLTRQFDPASKKQYLALREKAITAYLIADAARKAAEHHLLLPCCAHETMASSGEGRPAAPAPPPSASDSAFQI
jgi:hypothetical protein